MPSRFRSHCESLYWIWVAGRKRWLPWTLVLLIGIRETYDELLRKLFSGLPEFPIKIEGQWPYWLLAALFLIAVYLTFHQMRLMAADPAMNSRTAMRRRREQNLAALKSDLDYNSSNGDWGRCAVIDNERDEFPEVVSTGWFGSRLIGFSDDKFAEIQIGEVDLVPHKPSGGWRIARSNEGAIHRALKIGLLPLEWIEDIRIVKDNSGKWSRLYVHYYGIHGTPFKTVALYFRHNNTPGQIGYNRLSDYNDALRLSFSWYERFVRGAG